MKKFKFLLKTLLLSVIAVACSDDDNELKVPKNTVLTLNTNEVLLTSDEASGKLEIISNVDWMTLKGSNSDWFTVTPDQGSASADAATVTINATKNPSQEERRSLLNIVHTLGSKTDSVWIVQAGSIAEPLRYQDSLALVSLWKATKGPNWKVSWDLETPLSEWPGVKLDYINGQTRVVELVMPDNGLVGSNFPEEMANLTEMRKFVITAGILNFPIPEFISQWKNLYFLALVNGHTGKIPESIYTLTKLETLHLYGNQFEGGISEKLGDLVNMEDLNFQYAGLSGTLPKSISNLKKLEGLMVDGNKLSGEVPVEIAQCENIRILVLENNQFEGSLLNRFDNMTNLEHLELAYNNFSGELPALTNCSRIYDIRFSANKDITGSLPESWAALDSIIVIQGYDCSLSGTIPESYGDIKCLAHVILGDNMLTGNIPIWMTKLNTLSLESNKLSGSLNDFFAQSKNFELRLSGNVGLEGDVSTIFKTNVNLGNIQLSGIKNIIGTLPDGDYYAALQEIDISGTSCNGAIPYDLFISNTAISKINLADCNFTGNLPESVFNALNLNVLVVKGNKLSGEIPAKIKENANYSLWEAEKNIAPQQEGYGLTGI